MGNKDITYKLLKKQNGRMLFKAVLYFVFTPFLIPLSVFCLHLIVEIFKIVGRNFKNAFYIFKNFFAPRSYKPLKEYDGEFDDVSKYFTEKGNGVFLSENFLLIKTKNSFDIIPKSSVVWVYYRQDRTTTRRRYSGVTLATDIDYGVMICTELGKRYQCRISQSHIGFATQYNMLYNGEALDTVIESLPHAVLGYSKNLDIQFKNNPKTFLEKNNINPAF